MNLNEYQEAAQGTAIYPGRRSPLGLMYVALKLNGEAGEFAEHVGKAMRDDGFGMPADFIPGSMRAGDPGNGHLPMRELTAERHMLLVKECGDVLWYIAAIAHELGLSLDEVARINLAKLADRKARQSLSGAGDNR